MDCSCGSDQLFMTCCHHVWQQGGSLSSAEQVMRARYSAYVRGNIDFLVATTLAVQQAKLDLVQIKQWSEQTEWLGLQVISHTVSPHSARHAWVEFRVACRENGQQYIHHERSAFVRDETSWRFIDPTVALKVERNQLCVCGSKQKFKRCCAPMLVRQIPAITTGIASSC